MAARSLQSLKIIAAEPPSERPFCGNLGAWTRLSLEAVRNGSEYSKRLLPRMRRRAAGPNEEKPTSSQDERRRRLRSR
jgi:hypothetical protein